MELPRNGFTYCFGIFFHHVVYYGSIMTRMRMDLICTIFWLQCGLFSSFYRAKQEESSFSVFLFVRVHHSLLEWKNAGKREHITQKSKVLQNMFFSILKLCFSQLFVLRKADVYLRGFQYGITHCFTIFRFFCLYQELSPLIFM